MKITLILLGLALLIFIGYGLFKANGLKTIEISKKITIKGDQQEVFDMVRYLNNFPKWSPFLKQDPAQRYEVKGKDGSIGAQYHWNGNGGKDIGYQEIVKVDTFSFVHLKCHIEKPFTAHPDFMYAFTKSAEGITVTQNFKLESDLGSAFFLWLFGAKKEMEKTNEYGLQLLKQSIEK